MSQHNDMIWFTGADLWTWAHRLWVQRVWTQKNEHKNDSRTIWVHFFFARRGRAQPTSKRVKNLFETRKQPSKLKPISICLHTATSSEPESWSKFETVCACNLFLDVECHLVHEPFTFTDINSIQPGVISVKGYNRQRGKLNQALET